MDGIGSVSFDHSTQYFTATPGGRFDGIAQAWADEGLVAEWPEGAVGTLDAGSGDFAPFEDGASRFVGVGGLRPLCDFLASGASEVIRPQWVGCMTPVGCRGASFDPGFESTESTTRFQSVIGESDTQCFQLEPPCVVLWSAVRHYTPAAVVGSEGTKKRKWELASSERGGKMVWLGALPSRTSSSTCAHDCLVQRAQFPSR